MAVNLDDELARAAAIWSEADAVRQQLAAASAQAAESAAGAAVTKKRAKAYAREVRKRRSLAFVKLRGSHGEELARHIADRDEAAAEYRMCQELADADQRVVDELKRHLDGFGDFDTVYRNALTAKENWLQLHGGATALLLLQNTQSRKQLESQLGMLQGAQAAAVRVLQELQEAARHLASARSYAQFGFMMERHERSALLGRAADGLRSVDGALKAFEIELREIQLTGLRTDELRGFSGFLAAWVEKVFRDLEATGPVVEAQCRIAAVTECVNNIWVPLEQRRLVLCCDLERLQAQRDNVVLRA